MSESMKWIGVTGPIGSGKTEVSYLLKKEGFVVLSADEIVKKIIQKNFKNLLETLGLSGIENHGDLKEWALKNLNNLNQLEEILHPLVRQEVEKERLNLKDKSMVFYEIPLLFEKNLESSFDVILLVASTKVERTRRLLKKGLPQRHIDKIMSRQNDLEDSRKKADFVIENEGNLEELKNHVKRFLSKIKG